MAMTGNSALGQSAILEETFRTCGPSHFCNLSGPDEGQMSIVVPFLVAGIRKNEKCVYVSDKTTEEEILESILSYESINPDALERSLTVCQKEDLYLVGGSFEMGRVLKDLVEFERRSRAEGFAGFRGVGEMTWARYDARNMEMLPEYEARINSLYPELKANLMCQYDEAEFEAATLMDVIGTHPRISIRGTVCWNPYFVPPEEFLPWKRGEVSRAMYDRACKDVLKRARFTEIHLMELKEFRRANRKIDVFNDLLFKEMQSQLLVMSFFSDLAVDSCKDARTRDYVLEVAKKCEELQRRLNSAKSYLMIGSLEPHWQPLAEALDLAVGATGLDSVKMNSRIAGIEVLSDNLLGGAFQTILENLRRVRKEGLMVEISCLKSMDGIIVAFEGDCLGVQQSDKELLFNRDYSAGGFDGYELFLVREVLRGSGMNVREVGEPGRKVRFEITIPPNRFRVIQ